jgi:hypothetical protein
MSEPEKDRPPGPSPRAAFANWKNYDAPLATKLQMLLTNNLTKIRTRQQCCGHPGQPGC